MSLAVLGPPGVIGFAVFMVIQFVHGRIPALIVIPLLVWTAVCLVGAVRQAMLGVYVGDDGVRSRSMLRTTTVPWASVSEIRNGVATMAGLDMGRAAITIDRTDGGPVQTPLQRGDILRPFTFRPELGRLTTWPEHYDEILATLRACHRDWQSRTQTTGRVADASSTGTRPTSPSLRVNRTGALREVPVADRRRDIHALTRQHQRGALTDAEFAAQLAKIHGGDQIDGVANRTRR